MAPLYCHAPCSYLKSLSNPPSAMQELRGQAHASGCPGIVVLATRLTRQYVGAGSAGNGIKRAEETNPPLTKSQKAK